MADVDRELRRIRTGNQAGRAEVVEKLLVCEPAATANDFVLHHRDVRRRTAERDRTEPEEEERDFAEGRPHFVLLPPRASVSAPDIAAAGRTTSCPDIIGRCDCTAHTIGKMPERRAMYVASVVFC